MKHLHYNLTRKWFEMIYLGTKTEEYREIKPSIISILFDWKESGLTRDKFTDACKNEEEFIWCYLKHDGDATITFSNGYSRDRDQYEISWDGIKIGIGKEKWGAKKGEKYFIHNVGYIINTNFLLD